MDEEMFKRILQRERNARKESEKLLEEKSLELWKLNQSLEVIVKERTAALENTLIDLERTSEAKSIFLSNMSHEIRTPLNAIIGFVNFMHNAPYKKEEFNHYFSIIRASSNNLLQIINDILDISKIQSGKFLICVASVNLKEVIENTVSLFNVPAKEAELIFSCEFDENFPQYLETDDTRVVQILSNFISNAIKFTPVGGKVCVKIAYGYSDQTLIIKVDDTGIGIDEKAQKSIFNAFEQEDAGTTRDYGGTGLGLSISSSLISLMGGDILFNSIKGKGSSFGFKIPARHSPESREEILNCIEKKECYMGKILLVEDNKTNIILMKIFFDELSVEYDVVFNGKEAVDIIKNNEYVLILMDNQMPILNGLEATVEIRKFNKTIPIVALTANVMKEEQDAFIEAGMQDVLAKPINKDKFIEVLNTYLYFQK